MVRCQGMTLVELMVVIACLAILLRLGATGYSGWQQRQRLDQLMLRVQSDILWARQQVLTRQSPTNLSVRFFPGSRWCYRVTDQGAASCSGCEAACGLTGYAGIKGSDSQAWPGIQLAEAALPAQTLGFDARRGGMTAGSLHWQSSAGSRRLVINGYGRLRLCAGATAQEAMAC